MDTTYRPERDRTAIDCRALQRVRSSRTCSRRNPASAVAVRRRQLTSHRRSHERPFRRAATTDDRRRMVIAERAERECCLSARILFVRRDVSRFARPTSDVVHNVRRDHGWYLVRMKRPELFAGVARARWKSFVDRSPHYARTTSPGYGALPLDGPVCIRRIHRTGFVSPTYFHTFSSAVIGKIWFFSNIFQDFSFFVLFFPPAVHRQTRVWHCVRFLFSIQFCQSKNSCVSADKTVQPFIIREKKAFATVLPRRLCHFKIRSTIKVPWAVKTTSGDFKIGIDKPLDEKNCKRKLNDFLDKWISYIFIFFI